MNLDYLRWCRALRVYWAPYIHHEYRIAWGKVLRRWYLSGMNPEGIPRKGLLDRFFRHPS